MADPNALINNPAWQSFATGLEQDRGLAPGLLSAIAANETAGGSPKYLNATSTAGAQGMFQFIPGTAKQYNVNVNDTADSTRGAADYLADLSKKYNDPHLAAAAYNWGPGNLDKAMAKAKAANLPTDALSLAGAGLLPAETAAYVRKLPASFTPMPSAYGASPDVSTQAAPTAPSAPSAFSPDVIQNTRASVLHMASDGMNDRTIVDTIAKGPVAPMISTLRSQGTPDADIVSQIGGKSVDAYRTVQDESGFTTAANMAGEGLSGLARGAKQIFATGQNATDLQAQQKAVEADPLYQARMGTTSGKIGYYGAQALPLAAADLVAPEVGLPLSAARAASVIGRSAALGATQGALTPTTDDGQRTSNVLTGATIGGGLGAAGQVAGAAVRGGQAVMRGGRSIDDLNANVADLTAQGINPGANMLSPRAAQAVNGLDSNVLGSSWLGANKSAAREGEFAGAIGRGVGVDDATSISSGLVRKAEENTGKLYSDALDGVHLNLGNDFQNSLDGIIAKNQSTTLPSLSSSLPASVASDLKNLAAAGPVEAKTLQQIRSNVGAALSSPSTELGAKRSLGEIYETLNDAIQSNLPADKLASFQKANEQYRNLQAVKTMVQSSGDAGVVTQKQFVNAIKRGGFKNDFSRGDAPYQDLQSAMAGAQTPSSGSFGDVGALTKAVGLGALVNPIVPIKASIAGNLAMRVLTDPKYRDVLLGLSPAQRGALMQAASAAGPIGTTVGTAAATQP